MNKKTIKFFFIIFTVFCLTLFVTMSIYAVNKGVNLNKLNSEIQAQEASPQNKIAVKSKFLPKYQLSANLIMLLMALIIVGALIIFYFQKKRYTKNDNSLFTILDSFPINKKQTLLLVKLSNMLLIIASSENSLKLIKEIKEPKAIKEILQEKGYTNFDNYLDAILENENQ